MYIPRSAIVGLFVVAVGLAIGWGLRGPHWRGFQRRCFRGRVGQRTDGRGACRGRLTPHRPHRRADRRGAEHGLRRDAGEHRLDHGGTQRLELRWGGEHGLRRNPPERTDDCDRSRRFGWREQQGSGGNAEVDPLDRHRTQRPFAPTPTVHTCPRAVVRGACADTVVRLVRGACADTVVHPTHADTVVRLVRPTRADTVVHPTHADTVVRLVRPTRADTVVHPTHADTVVRVVRPTRADAVVPVVRPTRAHAVVHPTPAHNATVPSCQPSVLR